MDEPDATEPITEVEPLDVTGVRTVTAGTVLFAVAALMLFAFRGRLEDADRAWWLWVCVAGFGLGMFGVQYCRRRARRSTGARPPVDQG